MSLKKHLKNIIGGLAGATGVYKRHFRSRMVVIAFHRVNDILPLDGLTCRSEKFEAFCEFFADYFEVVPFRDQVRACTSGGKLGGSLSITFDDGYLDNFEVAAPILRKHKLPATFFLTTGFINSTRVPFWDEKLPSQPGWMSWDQVRTLSQQGFDIGAHTETHIDMAVSDRDTIRRELQLSKQVLQREIGKTVDLFVYPFGGPSQITEDSLELVKEAGFISCASCYGGTNSTVADPFRLKRIGVAEWFATPHQLGVEMLLGKA